MKVHMKVGQRRISLLMTVILACVHIAIFAANDRKAGLPRVEESVAALAFLLVILLFAIRTIHAYFIPLVELHADRITICGRWLLKRSFLLSDIREVRVDSKRMAFLNDKSAAVACVQSQRISPVDIVALLKRLKELGVRLDVNSFYAN